MSDTTCFYYDPLRSGYDENLWRTLVGAPAVIGAGRLKVDSGAIIGYGDITKGDITMNINVPTAPGADASRVFGLYQPSRAAFIVFTIDDNLTVSISDGTTTTTSDELEWNTDWTAANIDFRIVWEAGMVKFYINGGFVAVLSGDNVPHGPLSLYFYDDSGTPMGIGNIDVRGARYYMNLKTTDSTVYGAGFTMSQAVTVTEAATIKIPILVPNVSDAVTLSDAMVPLIPTLFSSKFDSVTITENVSGVNTPHYASVYDEVSVSENLATE